MISCCWPDVLAILYNCPNRSLSSLIALPSLFVFLSLLFILYPAYVATVPLYEMAAKMAKIKNVGNKS